MVIKSLNILYVTERLFIAALPRLRDGYKFKARNFHKHQTGHIRLKRWEMLKSCNGFREINFINANSHYMSFAIAYSDGKNEATHCTVREIASL